MCGIHVYVYVYNVYVYIYVYIYICIYIYIYMYIYSYMHASEHTHTCKQMHMFVYAYIHLYTLKRHTHTHTHIYIYIYTHCAVSRVSSRYPPYGIHPKSSRASSLLSQKCPQSNGWAPEPAIFVSVVAFEAMQLRGAFKVANTPRCVMVSVCAAPSC